MQIAEIQKIGAPVGNGLGPSGMVARFGVSCAALYSLSILIPDECYGPLNRLTAQLAGMLLGFFNAHGGVLGTTLSLNGFRALIITECSGLYLFVLFVCFVACAPVPLRAKCSGLLVGIPFLNAANVIRIALVTVIGAWQPGLFEFAHVYLMQLVMIMLVCVTCLVWHRWATASHTKDGPFDFLVRLVALASILFVLWLPVHRQYVAFLDRQVIYLFSLIHRTLLIPPRPEIYHHTLSLVLFFALVCASRGVAWQRKVLGLAGGMLLLALVHMLLRVTQVLVTAAHLEWVNPIHLTFHLLNQYLLPVLLWLAVVRQKEAPCGPAPGAAR